MGGIALAKLETYLRGEFGEILNTIHSEVLRGSISATLEDSSDFASGPFRVSVRVYERYSMIGQNRLSMNVTLASDGPRIFLSAITAGGSQAMLFKINTFGEESFLNELRRIIKRYQ